MNEARLKAIEHLKKARVGLPEKEVTIGIDAFIDKILRLVQNKTVSGEYVYFDDIAQFGQHLITKAGKSGQMEACVRFTKLGGNAPLMADAVGSLGVKVNCVGAMGYPQIDPVFNGLSENIDLYTIGNPGYTTALEFDDGKIILSQREDLHRINWITMKNMLGMDKLKNFFLDSNVIGLVNWTGMIHFNDIFKGVIKEILPQHTPNKEQIIFFDMADFGERTKEDLAEAVDLINEFAKHYKVILGLNENETNLFMRDLYPDAKLKDIYEVGQFIFDHLKIDAFVIHTLTSSMAFEKNGMTEVESLYVKQPKLSTGGGDNFNGGLCFGQLTGMDFEGSLYVANAVSGFYVRNAKSPNLDDLINTLEQWEDLIEKC